MQAKAFYLLWRQCRISLPALSDANDNGALMPRVVTLDLIRGFAILGILLINVFSFARPADFSHSLLWTQAGYSALDELLYGIQTLFFSGRFLTLFNLLFGVSMLLIADKYGVAYLQRRLQWLAGFGLLHACLIWEGDILLWYAFSGLIVLRLGYLSLSNAQLWRKGALLFAIGLIMPALVSISVVLDAQPLYLLTADDIIAERLSWTTSYSERLVLMAQSNAMMLLGFVLSLYWLTAGLILFGAALYRQQWFSHGFSAKSTLALLLAGLMLSVLTLYLDKAADYQYELSSLLPWEQIAALLMALAYASLLIRLSRLHSIRQWLAPCGRMAFTLYLCQSLLMVALLRIAKPDWFASLDRLSLLTIALVVIALQLLLCRWYLRHFTQGPFEWLWRRLSGKARAVVAE
jgi:uncharacterized protein